MGSGQAFTKAGQAIIRDKTILARYFISCCPISNPRVTASQRDAKAALTTSRQTTQSQRCLSFPVIPTGYRDPQSDAPWIRSFNADTRIARLRGSSSPAQSDHNCFKNKKRYPVPSSFSNRCKVASVLSLTSAKTTATTRLFLALPDASELLATG